VAHELGLGFFRAHHRLEVITALAKVMLQRRKPEDAGKTFPPFEG
jgi:hypothetical protein